MKKVLVLAAIIAAAALAFCGGSKADELNRKQAEAFSNSVGVIVQTALVLGQETRPTYLGGATLITESVVLTSSHVIPRNMSSYALGEVVFSNNKCSTKVIQVLAFDTLSDLAVLMLDKKPDCMSVAKIAKNLVAKDKICTKREIPLPFPNNNGIMEKHIAFGNYEISHSDVSCSFVNKIYQVTGSNYLMFNAANFIEPGFSGFPTLNVYGEVAGVNSAVSYKYSIISHINNISHLNYFKF